VNPRAADSRRRNMGSATSMLAVTIHRNQRIASWFRGVSLHRWAI